MHEYIHKGGNKANDYTQVNRIVEYLQVYSTVDHLNNHYHQQRSLH